MNKIKKIFNPDKFSSAIFYLCTLFFIIAFNFSDNPRGGWYQQFLPNLNGREISDILFTDSLNGYATAYKKFDPNYILKTTNGGNNWYIVDSLISWLTHLQFLNDSVGYAGGADIFKTTNAGTNWFEVNRPSEAGAIGMYVLNEDSIWITDDNGLTGGIFLTTNGGASWSKSFYTLNNNPEKIYFYNKDLGFASNGQLLRTSNGGVSWSYVSGAGDFLDISFIDSLTGWKAFGNIKKTTDGGMNWIEQSIPPKGGIIEISSMESFSVVTDSILWGVGGNVILSGGRRRALIYKTTNGGTNWGYQIPDTGFYSLGLKFCNFIDKQNGWAYQENKGLHTVSGGNDTTYFVTSINQTAGTIPVNYKLYQNYPNPFNPLTKIKYQLKTVGFVTLKVFNIRGMEVKEIVIERQIAGEYEVTFSATEPGSGLSSGAYFYSLLVDGKLFDTKKMIVIK